MVGLLTKWRRAEQTLFRELGRTASFDELSTFLGLSATQASLVAKAHQARQLKLENRLGVEVELSSSQESANRCEPVGATMETDEERTRLLDRLERLDPRERMVVVLRDGIEGEQPMTLKQVGCRLGITHEWVRKIEHRAIQKLHCNAGRDHGGNRPQPSSLPRRSPARQVAAPKPPFLTTPRQAKSQPGSHARA